MPAYSLSASIGDMVAILDDLGIERSVVGGHSLGGVSVVALAWSIPSERAHSFSSAPAQVSAMMMHARVGTGWRRATPCP